MYLEQSTECSRVWCRDADSLACDSTPRRAASDMWFVQSWDRDSLEKFSLTMCWKIHAKIIIVIVHLADFFPAHAAPYARRTQTPNEVVVCVETPREGTPSWGVSNSEQERRRLKWKRKSINAQDINYVWKRTIEAWGRRGVKPWRLFSLIFFSLADDSPSVVEFPSALSFESLDHLQTPRNASPPPDCQSHDLYTYRRCHRILRLVAITFRIDPFDCFHLHVTWCEPHFVESREGKTYFLVFICTLFFPCVFLQCIKMHL